MLNFIKNLLQKTRSQLGSRLRALFGKPWSDETFDELEQILFEADLGAECVTEFVDALKSTFRTRPISRLSDLIDPLKTHALKILNTPPCISPSTTHSLLVILIVGVNGSGKTTSIAKLAHRFKSENKKVLIAAADTFRAAAIEQLEQWANRLEIDLIKSQPGADPSAVAFDAITAAKARGTDIVLIDTAGRLQNKTDLMRELEKIRRVCQKLVPEAPHETWLILDATTGQNALDQAQAFHLATPLTGIILTKLDGSTKGGILLSVYRKHLIPIRWIGTGEQLEDLEPFDPSTYVDALFEP